ncbi:MAG: hypothetical protein K2M87_01215, partial [Muribaculaceae bacterium]|nr:hypothetical protein [Muribaculaceae bacterium]
MAAYSSILSCGVRLRKALLNSAQFRKLTDRVFPVVSRVDEKKPFVSFHRAETIQGENMDGRPPREGYFQFQVYTAEREEGV